MDDLSQMLVAQLPTAKQDVDVFLALQALTRTNPESACGAILQFLRSASERQAELAKEALISLADRAVVQLEAATLDECPVVAEAAKRALLYLPSNEALPFYLRLGKSKSIDDITTALVAMGRLSTPDVRVPLLKALSHRNLTVRTTAAEALRYQADDSWLPELLEAIRALRLEEAEKKKDYSDTINALCDTFTAKASTANLELLLAGLQDSDSVVRKTCIAALGRVGGEPAVLALIDLLPQPNRGVRYKSCDPTLRDLRCEVVNALGQLGDARAIWPLLAVELSLAAPALGQLNAQEAVQALMAALAETKVPREADDLAKVLAQLAGPGEQQWPRVALQSESLTVRRAAALALYDLAPEDATPHLLNILTQLAPGDAIYVAKALAEQGRPEGLQGLAAALEDDPLHWNASAVAHVCQTLRGAKVQTLLLGLLPDISNQYVDRVCKALAAQGAAVLPALINAAQTSKRDTLYRYTLAIMEIRDPECAEQLAALLLPSNPLRDAAMLALAKMPGDKASAAVSAVLRRADKPADQRYITELLTSVATRDAIPDLLDALAKGHAEAEILDALARIADASTVPALLALLNSTPQRKGVSLASARAALPALLQASDVQDAWVREGLASPGTRLFWLASVKQLDTAIGDTATR